jgi:hypothetical protein
MSEARKNKSKHQHWVPQSYLKYFGTPESRTTKHPQIYLFDKESSEGEARLTSVRNVCGRRYLNSPADENGVRDWALEEALCEVEAALSVRWIEFSEGKPALSDGDLRNDLALFIATLHLRNVEISNLLVRIMDLRTKLYGPLSKSGHPDHRTDTQTAPQKLGQPVDQTYRPDATDPHRFFVQTVWSRAHDMAKTFSDMRWTVLCTDADMFITSDRPVGFQHAHRRSGPGTPGAIATFPINPRRLLLMDDRKDQPPNQYLTLPASDAGAFNRMLWLTGVRFVLTGRAFADVLQEIQSYS